MASELDDDQILAILGIGHDASIRGIGVSLRDALAKTNYAAARPHLEADDLVPFIQRYPALVEQWIGFSEDKRTDGGWYLTRQAEVGMLFGAPKEKFVSQEAAVAEYVLRELDFWLDVGRRTG
jgi:hypothetical protein